MHEDGTRLWAPTGGGGTNGAPSSNAVKFAPLRLLQAARTLLEAQVQEQERVVAAAFIEAMRAGDQTRANAPLAGALDEWSAIEETRALLRDVEAEIRKRETAEPSKRAEASLPEVHSGIGTEDRWRTRRAPASGGDENESGRR